MSGKKRGGRANATTVEADPSASPAVSPATNGLIAAGYTSVTDCAYKRTGFGYLTGFMGENKRKWDDAWRFCEALESGNTDSYISEAHPKYSRGIFGSKTVKRSTKKGPFGTKKSTRGRGRPRKGILGM